MGSVNIYCNSLKLFCSSISCYFDLMQCKQESETVPLPSKAQIMFKLVKTQFVSAAAFGLVCHQIYLFVRKLPAGLCSLFLFFLCFQISFHFTNTAGASHLWYVNLVLCSTEIALVVSNHKPTDLKS